MTGPEGIVLDKISECWATQGFLGGVECEYSADQRTATIRAVQSPGNYQVVHECSREELATLHACHANGRIAVLAANDEKTKGTIWLTDDGVATVFNNRNSDNPIVRLVDMSLNARMRISARLRDQEALHAEVDRIRIDLQRELQHQNANEVYRSIAGNLHLLLLQDASQHLVRAEIKRRKALNRMTSLADLYFGDCSIYGIYDGLPNNLEDLKKQAFGGVADKMDWRTYLAIGHHNPVRFNPVEGSLLTKGDWVSQCLAIGGGWTQASDEAFYTIKKILTIIRNRMTSHTLPHEPDRQHMERFQKMIDVNGGTNAVAFIVVALGAYVLALLRLFSLCPYFPGEDSSSA